MKSINNIKYSFVAVVFAFLILSGCHQTNSGNPQAFVGLHFNSYVYDTVLDPVGYTTQAFPDSLGRVEHLSVAQFYLTNLGFRNKSTQQWYTIPGSIILKRIDNELYPVGNIPAGTYDAIQFTVGLGNTLNSKTPSWYTTGGPDTVLSATEQAVMWLSNMAGSSATTGYTFMNVQGYDSTDHLPFNYQIGGYGDTVQVTLPFPAGFTLAADEPSVLQLIHVIADYGKLLQVIRPITPANNNSTFYGPSPGPANTLLNNIINMFRYECTSPTTLC